MLILYSEWCIDPLTCMKLYVFDLVSINGYVVQSVYVSKYGYVKNVRLV